MPGMSTDFEAEGLLEGLDGDAREARLELLGDLEGDGVPLEELKAAVEEDRIALLPVERVYDPPGDKRTIKEVAEEAGVPVEALTRYQRALGLRVPDEDERVAGEHLVEMAKLLRGFLDAGLPENGLIEVTRVIGLAMSQVARAVSQLTAETVLADAESERDVAIRLAEAARLLTPMANEIFDHAFRVHQLEVLRSEVVGSEQIQAGKLAGSQEYTVAFADLVGFTKLGERLDPEDYGQVTERLAELAADIAEPPVRLVKLIGDAAMLASRENAPVINAALALQAAAMADDELPDLRIGVARGPALPRAGDLYGRAVNLASRLTAIAKPGSVLADKAAKEASEGDFNWSSAGSKRIKGIRSQVKLYRARD
jgi:adenylate cyclase